MSDLALLKGLPASVCCEKLVLGTLLTGTEFQLVTGLLCDNDFSIEKHRRIFRAMAEVYRSGTRVGLVSTVEMLRRQNHLESCDGMAYLSELSDIPELVDLEHYCTVVKDKSILRRLALNAEKLRDQCLLDQDTPDTVLARFGDLLRNLEGETTPQNTLRRFSEIIERGGGLDAYCHPEELGIQTPWSSLNRIIGGFRPGQMTTMAGLTGSGKSAAALQIAIHAAEKQKIGVALFSLEMSEREIFERAACGRAGLDSKKLQRGALNDQERRRFIQAASELSELPLYIDDTTNCTLASMRHALRKHIQRHDIGLLIIDYLQLMQTIGRMENRTQQVSEISRGMKLAAREFGIPVLVLAQFNRAPAIQNRAPQLHDLRESGSIEQDSDKVIFIHAQETAASSAAVESERDVRIIVAKQRDGKSGRYVELLFIEKYARFDERVRDDASVS